MNAPPIDAWNRLDNRVSAHGLQAGALRVVCCRCGEVSSAETAILTPEEADDG